MSTGPVRSAVTEGLASSVGVGLWYALPDLVRSRSWRAVLKTGYLGAVVAYGALGFRRDDAASEGGASGDQAPATAGDDLTQRVRALTSTTPVIDAAALDLADDDEAAGSAMLRAAGVAALAAAGVVGAVAGMVAAERGIFRLGERWRDQGLPLAHTRIGVVSGVATALLAAATTELERRATIPTR